MAVTAVLTLSDFLLARIAEDEAAATEARDSQPYALDEVGGAIAEGMRLVRQSRATRVLAECEAKRRIAELHHPSGEYDPDSCVLCQWDCDCDAPKPDHKDGAGEWPCPTLKFLAAVYADHPGYREVWS